MGVTFCEICGFFGDVVDEEMDDEEDELLAIWVFIVFVSTASVRSFWNKSRLVDTMLNWILSLIDVLLVSAFEGLVLDEISAVGGLGMLDLSLLVMIW